MSRAEGRANDELRPTRITAGVLDFAEGSALIEAGATRVLCAATVEDRVPPFRVGSGLGWVTAEYAMLPRATLTRTPRESHLGGPRGRTHEIQRMVGRALRAVVDLRGLGERTITVDCDVIQADGGTRTAAVTAGYVALHQAIASLVARQDIAASPINAALAAVSVGVVDGELLLDLCYEEDRRAEVDFNIVMTEAGEYVEVQGAGEEATFSQKSFAAAMDLAWRGLQGLMQVQRSAIAHP